MPAASLLLVAIAALACLAPTATAQGAGSGTYTIKAGETFRDVAQAKGFTVDAILAANPGVVPEKLQVGQVVKLPCLSGGAVGTQAQRPATTGTGRRLLGGTGFCADMAPLVNGARAEAGLGPVGCAAELDDAAQGHSNDMANGDFMSHTGSDGSSIADRIWPATDAMGCGRGVIAENVAQRFPDDSAQVYFDGWMNSPGHRANILNPDITHTGLRTASNGAKEYATKVFAQCR